MGGGGDAAVDAGLLQCCAQEADNRPLAVGASHLNRGDVTTGRSKCLDGMAHPLELQIHAPQIKAWDQIRQLLFRHRGDQLSPARVASSRLSNWRTSWAEITSGGTILSTVAPAATSRRRCSMAAFASCGAVTPES